VAMTSMSFANLSDDSGDLIETAAVHACIEQAQRLITHTRQWFKDNRPDLIQMLE
jgi:hypothetical protein